MKEARQKEGYILHASIILQEMSRIGKSRDSKISGASRARLKENGASGLGEKK